jgi:large repetitive protein
MNRLALIVVVVAVATGVSASPGSAASFNDGAPCPASGPLLVCPTMNVGQSVHLQLLARDGCDVYRWEIVNSSLPPGLSLSSSGVVSGTPTTPGSWEDWVWVHDLTAKEGGPSWCGGDNHSERQFVFNVVGSGGGGPAPAPAPPPAPAVVLQITTANLAAATTGAAYSATLAASGGGGVTWTVSGGSLPNGLTLGSNGVVSGTPGSAGDYTFTVRASGGGASTSKQFQIVVREQLSASAPADQTWEVGRPLQISIDAKGGAPGYSWKLSGTLPAKTGFIADKGNGSTAVLQGVPAEAGTFPLVLTVTDAAGVSTEVKVTLTVAPKLRIETTGIGRASVGKGYRLSLVSNGGVGAHTWALASGALPSGLKLDATTGVISGKTSRSGRFRFTVVVTDSLGAKSAMTYTLRVVRH